MRKRTIITAASILTIFGGATLLSAPQASAAAFPGCPTNSVREAVRDLGTICENGGSGVINCYEDGSWDWDSVSCN